MVIDFSEIDMRERPKFILRNLDGTPIGNLGHILEPTMRICYTEVSELQFKYPSADNGEKLDEYDLLTGMRVIDVDGYGQFLLQNPVEEDNTVSKVKNCTAYSLEYELANKKIVLEEGTYNFWNPLAPDGTIMGIILSEIPSWSIGSISQDLIGKYRTFSADNQGIYDFMRSSLQESYDCIFDFDTKNRVINARSIADAVPTKAVYLSSDNLLDEIKIQENTDELVTVLDVHGADDLNIRSVNPMGVNKIYNLDAYMNESYFPDGMIRKWNTWKSTFKSYQQIYFDKTVEQSMLISSLVTERAVLAELEGELKTLESKQAALVQGAAMDKSLEDDLAKIKTDISNKQKEISTQKNSVIEILEGKISAITNELKNINQLTAFSGEKSVANFTSEEMKILDRYFKCGSLTDTSFVATTTDSYSTDGTTVRNISSIFNLGNLVSVTETKYGDDKTFYSIRGGKIETSHSDFSLTAEIVRGTLEVNTDNSFVFSVFLNQGKLNNKTDFNGGTLSMTGSVSSVNTTDTTLQFKTSSASVYFTREVTEYQKQSIEMELYEYAMQYLKKVSQPTYYFSVESGNFLALDDFTSFAKEFSLGQRLYLHLNDTVYEPFVLAVEINFDDLSDFAIEFNEYYQSKEGVMDIRQILEQSVSTSNTLDFNQYLYSSFVTSGAKTSVDQFMKSAIDTMKNNIMSGKNNELLIDGSGLRCRKFNETSGEYSPKQIWMAHNAIMFTENNWESATIGIGEFTDKNFGTLYGIVLPALVGTLLAGKNLIIESEKQDGGVAVFKMDSEGASLHNASFNLYGTTGGRIDMGAVLGLVGGGDPSKMFTYDKFNNPTGVLTENKKSVKKVSELNGDTPNANFWLDMDGGIYIKGVIDAVGGIFRGSLEVGGSTAFRVDSSGNLKIGGTDANPNFSVSANGNLTANNGTFKGTVYGATYKDANGNSMMNNSNQFKAGYLNLNGINVGNGQFVVDGSGNVTVSGSIKMGAGSSIDWGTVSNSNLDKSPAYALAQGAAEDASDAYDLAWANRNTDKNIFDVLTGGGSRFGIFSDSSSSRLYINANYIHSGTIDADIITLGSDWGGFTCAMGSDGVSSTYGAKMYGSDPEFYYIATNKGVRMQAPDHGLTITNGGLFVDEEITVSSDRRLKHSVEYDFTKFHDFYMALKPALFRYNHGRSGRYHVGFIAQEVEDALLNNGLTTTDFAGLVVSPVVEKNEKDGIEDFYYRLRYGEFISLNTSMIQNLYREVNNLKEKLNAHGII